MIKELKVADINGLNNLPPLDWGFDYESFLRDFLANDFFYAFVQIKDDQIVGTGNVFLKGNIGWLANIIVDTNHRGQGLGHEMTKFLVDFLSEKQCDTQLLIATPLGEAIYTKLGFRKITTYQRFDSTSDLAYTPPSSIRKLETSDLKAVCKLDQIANAEDRKHLIEKFSTNGFGYFNIKNELLGFYLPQFGRGLVLSQDEQAGNELLRLKHTKKGKRTLLPVENTSGVELLEQLGLKKGDTCSRMVLGKENKWKPTYIYSYGSGYCG